MLFSNSLFSPTYMFEHFSIVKVSHWNIKFIDRGIIFTKNDIKQILHWFNKVHPF